MTKVSAAIPQAWRQIPRVRRSDIQRVFKKQRHRTSNAVRVQAVEGRINREVRFRSFVASRASRNLNLSTLGVSVQISHEKVNKNVNYFATCNSRSRNVIQNSTTLTSERPRTVHPRPKEKAHLVRSASPTRGLNRGPPIANDGDIW